MNIEKACQILHIENRYDVSEIKKKYKRESRRHHPDRGGDSKRFILIKDAYDLLLLESKKPPPSMMDGIDINLLKYYLYYTQGNPLFDNPIIEKYINQPIHEYLSQHKSYELTPSLARLLRKEIFYMNEHDIYIPLWHDNIVYYHCIHVNIVPILPTGITIDDNNDIIINEYFEYNGSITLDGISISITAEEYANKKIIGKGIPRIKNNIYDISDIGDILIYW